MQGWHEEKIRIAAVLLMLLFTRVGTAGGQKIHDSQDNFHLHAKLKGRSYRDDKIEIHAPGDWSIAVDTLAIGGSTQMTIAQGAILRTGKYILRLCTGCMQASGITGGRFSEIAEWFNRRIAAIRERYPVPVARLRPVRSRRCLTESTSGTRVIHRTSSTKIPTIAASHAQPQRSGTVPTLKTIVRSVRRIAVGFSSTTAVWWASQLSDRMKWRSR
jgi:hypothetical protein